MLNSILLTYKVLCLKFGWRYSYQTWSVSLFKGCSHLIDIIQCMPLGWGVVNMWDLEILQYFDFVAARVIRVSQTRLVEFCRGLQQNKIWQEASTQHPLDLHFFFLGGGDPSTLIAALTSYWLRHFPFLFPFLSTFPKRNFTKLDRDHRVQRLMLS